MRDKVTRQCPQTTTFEEKGEPKQIRIEVLLLTSLTARTKRLREEKEAYYLFIKNLVGASVSAQSQLIFCQTKSKGVFKNITWGEPSFCRMSWSDARFPT